MPRFEPDLTKARANIRIFDRGDYELKITKAEPFINENEETGKVSAGCRFNVEMVGKLDKDGNVTDEFTGETVSQHRVYVHTEGGWGMAKQFILATLGYSRDEEDKADKEYFANADLSVDEDDEGNATGGNSWEDVVGKHVRATLDKRLYQGNEQQDFKGWYPATEKKGARKQPAAAGGARRARR
jgi:hypothetical protein